MTDKELIREAENSEDALTKELAKRFESERGANPSAGRLKRLRSSKRELLNWERNWPRPNLHWQTARQNWINDGISEV